jgi:hypothetical protein
MDGANPDVAFDTNLKRIGAIPGRKAEPVHIGDCGCENQLLVLLLFESSNKFGHAYIERMAPYFLENQLIPPD